MDIAKILSRTKAYLPKMLSDLGRVIAVPSVAPDFGGAGELKRCEVVSEIARESRLFDFIHRYDSNQSTGGMVRPNLVAIANGTDVFSPTTWVITHLDEVPPGEPEKWFSNPRELTLARERNGEFERLDMARVAEYIAQPNPEQLVVIGRSVDDNSKPGISAMYALRVLRDMGLRPKGSVGIAWVADEENGKSVHGIKYLAETEKMFHPNDRIVIPDFGNRAGSWIEVAEKSRIVLEITTTGKQGHAAHPYEDSVNALEHGAAFISNLLAHQRRKYIVNEAVFNPPYSTFQWTMSSEGGATPNTVCGKHVAKLDMRLLPDCDVEGVIREAEEMAREYSAKHGVDIRVATDLYRPAPPATSSDSPVVKSLVEAVKAVRDITPEIVGIGGGTCASHIRKVQIDGRYLQAAVYASLTETEHEVNERARLDHIVNDTAVFAQVFLS